MSSRAREAAALVAEAADAESGGTPRGKRKETVRQTVLPRHGAVPSWSRRSTLPYGAQPPTEGLADQRERLRKSSSPGGVLYFSYVSTARPRIARACRPDNVARNQPTSDRCRRMRLHVAPPNESPATVPHVRFFCQLARLGPSVRSLGESDALLSWCACIPPEDPCAGEVTCCDSDQGMGSWGVLGEANTPKPGVMGLWHRVSLFLRGSSTFLPPPPGAAVQKGAPRIPVEVRSRL